MDIGSIFDAVILGLIEGLTEFIPVSSTAHLILASHFLGFHTTGNTFAVLIQLGAVLAVLSVYAKRLTEIATTFPTVPESRRFVYGVLVAFLPAVVIGLLAHDFIKTYLFESPRLICIMLVLGGIVLLAVDKLVLKPRYTRLMDYSLPLCFKIGLFQCLAMIPGTSRSGSTIVGALLLGADKRSAAEFSFFLAMPTMAGAFALDFWKYRNELNSSDLGLITIGFVVSFVCALFVVRSLLGFVSRHGYAPFAWWRIAIGVIGLIALTVTGT
ncbi:undecaprenyl-diphosphatase 1 [Aureimonas endophytica]|uniref:Undecaprenyl-diphosphatase n=1 Tax=Aureimonas endophytica TaxID=2027858 RepID=A0A917EDU0_9HYPH|nr:undecaprenyl-diphosphate phosphatase [Aureimonas endophytica]GGE23532.1 undecaprenyl-diphosphatase 1 [Aureimonas endophytica]